MSKRSRRFKRKKEANGKAKHLHFRFYHGTGRIGHPAVIIDEKGEIAKGYVVTHHPEKSKTKAYALLDNPEILYVDETGRPKKGKRSNLI